MSEHLLDTIKRIEDIIDQGLKPSIYNREEKVLLRKIKFDLSELRLSINESSKELK
jgi:hypothetical protein